MRLFLMILCLWLPMNQPVYADIASAARSIEWVKGEFKDYEKDYPGFGYSQGYKSSEGWITVYSYTGGFNDWKEGLQDARLRQVLDAAIDEVKSQSDKGEYKDLATSPIKERNIAGTAYYQVDFRYNYGGEAIDSSLYLTVKNGMLLKYRISFYSEPSFSMNEAASSFIMRSQDESLSPVSKLQKI
jgi:hypothetical protein